MYTSNQLRRIYIEFFKERGHTPVPSSLLVPKDDPTLLFTSAGMVQFKNLWRGDVPLPYKRAVSIQKCLRGSDIEEVQVSGRHHTFFEMLGNFSFGDYFKVEAIKWAWEFITEVLDINKDRLSISVHLSDDESYDIWKDVIGIPVEKIMRMGDEDNFWGPAGGSGPCGPCTEILYENSKELIEIWNIVFPQYYQDKTGRKKSLKNKGVDTGMGLERLTMICQFKETTYETDLFWPIIEEIERLLSCQYIERKESFHIIADHIRALVFALSEGVYPSNEKRGYFVRKILRRALLEGNRLGVDKPFLYSLVPVVTDVMKNPYPEILQKRENIAILIKNEEEKFLATLKQGIDELEKVIDELEGKKLPSSKVYKLYDTHGFPPELVLEIARKRGYNVDIEEVEKIAQREREKARQSARFEMGEREEWKEFIKIEQDEFVGYDNLNVTSEIARLRQDGKNVELILINTPFYAESGGQIGDKGIIYSDNFEIEVIDTKLETTFHIHIGKIKRIESGKEIKGHVTCRVDKKSRRLIEANHTATHLLQAALRKILGEHIHQEGSWVGRDKMRFDFTHFSHLSESEIKKVEDTVNDWILLNIQVNVRHTSLKEAKKLGAIALFGEKYEEPVRMIEIGNVSRELCGGSHVKNTSDIGMFKIIYEAGVHTGIRRIEAVTSMGVRNYLLRYESLVGDIKQLLETRDIKASINKLLIDNQELKHRIRELQKNMIRGGEKMDDRLKKEKIDDIEIVTGYLPGFDIEDLRIFSDDIRSRPKKVCVVATIKKGRPFFVVSVSDDIKSYIEAGKIAASIGKLTGGGGGGRPHIAEAGGRPDIDIDDILAKVGEIVRALRSKKGK